METNKDKNMFKVNFNILAVLHIEWFILLKFSQ